MNALDDSDKESDETHFYLISEYIPGFSWWDFGQETDKEIYFYLNALDDSDKESDDTEDDDNYVGGLIL